METFRERFNVAGILFWLSRVILAVQTICHWGVTFQQAFSCFYSLYSVFIFYCHADISSTSSLDGILFSWALMSSAGGAVYSYTVSGEASLVLPTSSELWKHPSVTTAMTSHVLQMQTLVWMGTQGILKAGPQGLSCPTKRAPVEIQTFTNVGTIPYFGLYFIFCLYFYVLSLSSLIDSVLLMVR